MRILPTVDGHIALSLARPADISLVPALVESDAVGDPWTAVAGWARAMTSDDAAQRIELLGLPGGKVPDPSSYEPPPDRRSGVVTTALGSRRPSESPLVVDMTSLWAGPLCAHLLGLRGARVIKVESVGRPDGARRGPTGFFDLLHAGHEQLVLDFGNDDDIKHLRHLMSRADLVLESSRPRALRHLGIDADEVVREGTCWLSITARGRESASIGFGDDVAACAGMVLREHDQLVQVGDALADPMSGVAAATAASVALGSDEATLIDVSMIDVVAESVGPVPPHRVELCEDGWWVEGDAGRYAVVAPRVRP
jgi:hypothetical protein